MKKYTVGALVTASVFTIVEAQSEEEAIQIAESRGMQTFCYRCAGGEDVAEDSWSLSGELDGLPHDLAIDDVE